MKCNINIKKSNYSLNSTQLNSIKVFKQKPSDNIIYILLRDKVDKNRKISPLIVPKDSIQIDTSNLTIEEVFDKITKYLK